MKVDEELAKVESEMKALQERFLILTGAKQAFEMILKNDAKEEERKDDGQRRDEAEAVGT